jgi:S-phase kinase-associated protein 1
MEIILISSDEQRIKVDSKIIEKSYFLKNKIGNSNKKIEINLPEINSKTLQKIVNYLIHYKDKEPQQIPKPLSTNNLNNVTDEWDINFIKDMDINNIYELINASNYLEIPSLLDLACAYVITLIKGKSIEEMRKLFNIECDLSEEQIKEYENYNIS